MIKANHFIILFISIFLLCGCENSASSEQGANKISGEYITSTGATVYFYSTKQLLNIKGEIIPYKIDNNTIYFTDPYDHNLIFLIKNNNELELKTASGQGESYIFKKSLEEKPRL